MNVPLQYLETPVVQVAFPEFESAGVVLLVKREDLNHPQVSGNKWWKLKYNLSQAREDGKNTLLTFGGAYSNHLYATAAAAYLMGWNSVGIVRGERPLSLSPTLKFCSQKGMNLHFVSRADYRMKEEEKFISDLRGVFGDFYLIPEGGSNELAVKGVSEFAARLPIVDYVCAACGTGGTLSGLVNGLRGSETHVIGIAVLKDDTLKSRIEGFLRERVSTNWQLFAQYHFGGYARVTPTLQAFATRWEETTRILLDPAYTAKMFYGLVDLAKQGVFRRGSTVLAIHTGGLQGRSGELMK